MSDNKDKNNFIVPEHVMYVATKLTELDVEMVEKYYFSETMNYKIKGHSILLAAHFNKSYTAIYRRICKSLRIMNLIRKHGYDVYNNIDDIRHLLDDIKLWHKSDESMHYFPPMLKRIILWAVESPTKTAIIEAIKNNELSPGKVKYYGVKSHKELTKLLGIDYEYKLSKEDEDKEKRHIKRCISYLESRGYTVSKKEDK